jgi:hypothetical protein
MFIKAFPLSALTITQTDGWEFPAGSSPEKTKISWSGQEILKCRIIVLEVVAQFRIRSQDHGS